MAPVTDSKIDMTAQPVVRVQALEGTYPQPEDHKPISEILKYLVNTAPADYVTPGWLLENLGDRSFGVLVFVLALFSLAPGVCALTGVVLMVLATQIVLGHTKPVLPPRAASQRIPTQRVVKVIGRILPALIRLERIVRPRGHTSARATKLLAGLAVFLLAAAIYLPIPFSNIPAATIMMFIAFAYLAKDGVLLTLSLVAAVATQAILLWMVVGAADWLRAV